MHHRGIVVTGEEVARSTHVSGQLVHLVERPVDDVADKCRIPQVTLEKPVGATGSKGRPDQVDTGNLIALPAEPIGQVRADKSPGPTNQDILHASNK